VASLESKQKTERKALTKQKLKKATVLKKLSKKIAAQRGEIKKLKRDEKRLSNLVKKLAAISKKRTKKTSKKRKSKIIAKNRATPDNRYAGKKFASLKGILKLPVRGEVMNRYGKARPDSGVLWKGLFIRAKEGADVKSVASGRVVFAEWMRGFGNLIIVDHGSGYMSLYGNNQSVLKDVGQEVRGGDTIASVGNSGGNTSHGVYYELRRKSITFDPLKWSKVR
jgi:septal ring factor EnvC (AmiA/AmiB activator)